MILLTFAYYMVHFMMALYNLEDSINTPNPWFDVIILASGLLNIIIFPIIIIIFVCIHSNDRWKTIMTQVKSGNKTLQTDLTEKILEIANLKRQLNNERNDRRAEVEDPLPPHTEQENEREPLLLEINSPDYLEHLSCSLPLQD